MKRTTCVAGVAVMIAVTAAVGAVAMSGRTAPSAAAGSATTAAVTKGDLAATVSMTGTLTHRARPDGSPYAVVNHARGVYTALPAQGDAVDCGDVLYQVDDAPVLLLCGEVPAYRDLRTGNQGSDVRQLNANLHTLGADDAAGVNLDPKGDVFTSATRRALQVLQERQGLDADGTLKLAWTVFLPDSVRIVGVSAQLGGSAAPGTAVADAASDVLEVAVRLDPAQQGEVSAGDPARITLPGTGAVTGKVTRVGRVAQLSGGEKGTGSATIPAFVGLDDPAAASGLDAAPVRVEITTTEVADALSVPVVALVGKSGGGYAVEVVRDGDLRDLVVVTLGLFDATGGRVQVSGVLREGDRVVVPSP